MQLNQTKIAFDMFTVTYCYLNKNLRIQNVLKIINQTNQVKHFLKFDQEHKKASFNIYVSLKANKIARDA